MRWPGTRCVDASRSGRFLLGGGQCTGGRELGAVEERMGREGLHRWRRVLGYGEDGAWLYIRYLTFLLDGPHD
jgi:hypothetical protein